MLEEPGIMAEDTDDEADRRDAEIARYRRASEEALEQLEWCVNYLYRIRKPRIAEGIDKNRRRIRQQMSRSGG
jgi:hypothetical protein